MIKKHLSRADLVGYLDKKQELSPRIISKFKNHLDNCVHCWDVWNDVRWRAAEGSRGYKELEDYLGDKFKMGFDSSWAIAKDWLKEKPKTEEQVADFYRHNSNYLYNLIIWKESGEREDFKPDFRRFKNEFGAESVIDYGCGVGNDGLDLLDLGFKTYLLDFDNPSFEFLKYRLEKRNLNHNAVMLNVDEIDTFPEADIFWAIDVLEHLKNPLTIVEKLPESLKIFAHRSEFGNDAGGRHPCHFSFDEIKLNEALMSRGFKHIPWPILSVWVRV